MELITKYYRKQPKDKIPNEISRMVKYIQAEMKQRFKILKYVVEKNKDDICFMVEIDFTSMDVIEPREIFIQPMWYEVNEEFLEGYTKRILESKRDTEYPRWGTYEEKLSDVRK